MRDYAQIADLVVLHKMQGYVNLSHPGMGVHEAVDVIEVLIWDSSYLSVVLVIRQAVIKKRLHRRAVRSGCGLREHRTRFGRSQLGVRCRGR